MILAATYFHNTQTREWLLEQFFLLPAAKVDEKKREMMKSLLHVPSFDYENKNSNEVENIDKDDGHEDILTSAIREVNNLSAKTLQIFFDAYSELFDGENTIRHLLLRRTVRGSTYLLLACATDDFDVEVFRYLIDLHRRTGVLKKLLMETIDRESRSTCLHIACRTQMKFECLKLLIEAYKEVCQSNNSAEMKNFLMKRGGGGSIPLEVACSRLDHSRHSSDALKLLCDWYDENGILEEALSIGRRQNDPLTGPVMGSLPSGPDCLVSVFGYHRNVPGEGGDEKKTHQFETMVEIYARIGKDFLHDSLFNRNNNVCLHYIADRRISKRQLSFVLELYEKYASTRDDELEKLLLRADNNFGCYPLLNCIRSNLQAPKLQMVIDFYKKHLGNDEFQLLLKNSRIRSYLKPIVSYRSLSLMETAVKHMKDVDSLKTLIANFDSEDVFLELMKKNNNKDNNKSNNSTSQETTAKSEEEEEGKRLLLSDKDCWKKCREWYISHHQTK